MRIYILFTSKDEELCIMALRGFKEIITNHGTRMINLGSITSNFEVALINSVRLTSPDIKIIGCLFHLKDALWRWARRNKLGNKDKEEICFSLMRIYFPINFFNF